MGILGAGLMGAGIAEISASGFDVMLKDSIAEGLSRGQQQIASNLDKKVKKRRLTKAERDMYVSFHNLKQPTCHPDVDIHVFTWRVFTVCLCSGRLEAKIVGVTEGVEGR